MKLAIYSIKETLFDGAAEKLVARTPMGEIAVLDMHIPLISSLLGPSVRVVSGKKEEKIPLSSGFLEVRPGSEVVVLVDS